MLRRISPIHRRGAATREQEELMQALREAQTSLDVAYLAFNNSTDPELVESCIFEIRALQARINYLLRCMKEQDARPAVPAMGGGKKKWI